MTGVQTCALPIFYHNRAVWPFVTAYALRAAERAHDAAHASAYAHSLLQGVAVALSNQENAEFLTLSPSFSDGALSGPVINSESQLWSVTAMLDLVVRSVFGVQVERDGIRIAPSFPAAMTGRMPEAGSVWTLTGLPLGSGHTTLRLHFPAKLAAQDWLEARSVRLDGLAWEMTKTLDPDHLPQQVDIELGARTVAPTALLRLEVSDPHHPTEAERAHLYAPPAPLIDAIADNGGRVKIAVGGVLAGHDWALWRDGAKVGTGHGTLATDHLAPNHGAVCYTLRQHAPRGLTSLPSAERCLPAAEGTVEVAAVDDAVVAVQVARRHGDVDHRRATTRPLHHRAVLTVAAEHVELQRDLPSAGDLDTEIAQREARAQRRTRPLARSQHVERVLRLVHAKRLHALRQPDARAARDERGHPAAARGDRHDPAVGVRGLQRRRAGDERLVVRHDRFVVHGGAPALRRYPRQIGRAHV